MGMGRAFTAVADDGNAVFVNPAGLAGIEGWQATSMYVSMFEGDIPYIMLEGSAPAGPGRLGLGCISSSSGQIPSPSSGGVTYFDYYDQLYFLSYAVDATSFFQGQKVYLGGSLKTFNKGFIGSGIDNTGSGMDMDAGIKYMPSPDLSFGIAAQNFFSSRVTWTSGSQDDIPMLIKIGVSKKLLHDSVNVALDADLSPGRQIPIPLHMGTEWKLSDNLTLRAGDDQMPSAASSVSNNPTFGLGFYIGGLQLDYAYHTYADYSAESTQFFSMSFQPEIFAPAPEMITVSIETVPMAAPAAQAIQPPPFTAEAAAPSMLYKVQVGNFNNLKSAVNLASKMQLYGFQAYAKSLSSGYYTVQVGAYREKIHADNAAAILRLNEFQPKTVLELE
jgi:hypothetical protein